MEDMGGIEGMGAMWGDMEKWGICGGLRGCRGDMGV